MKTFKAFIKAFNAQQRNVNKEKMWKFQLFFSLRPGSGREGLVEKWNYEISLNVFFLTLLYQSTS